MVNWNEMTWNNMSQEDRDFIEEAKTMENNPKYQHSFPLILEGLELLRDSEKTSQTVSAILTEATNKLYEKKGYNLHLRVLTEKLLDKALDRSVIKKQVFFIIRKEYTYTNGFFVNNSDGSQVWVGDKENRPVTILGYCTNTNKLLYEISFDLINEAIYYSTCRGCNDGISAWFKNGVTKRIFEKYKPHVQFITDTEAKSLGLI